MTSFGRRALEPGGRVLRSDGTADCDACEMPLFPQSMDDAVVHLACANRHHATAPIPRDEGVRRAVDGWIARHWAQVHAQHERWGTDDANEEEDDVGGR